MRDDGRLRTRQRHARSGYVPVAGSYVIVGCEDAESAVAKVLSIEPDGAIELQVLPGNVDDHRELLKSTA
jgi:hypothetical protein